MGKNKNELDMRRKGGLFERVAAILESARKNVVRAVNSEMVIAYWLIGREIVQALQSGNGRAEYGKTALTDLSHKLHKRYGRGFSVTNLRYFRLFYQAYSDRTPEIRHRIDGEMHGAERSHSKHHEARDELHGAGRSRRKHHEARDVFGDLSLAIEKSESIKGFSPVLSWTHYRTLTKVEHKNERLFYEIEAEREGWSVSILERQIQ